MKDTNQILFTIGALLIGLLIVPARCEASNSPPPCLQGTEAVSGVYGYTVSYQVEGHDGLCSTTFKTLEEAEFALRQDPSGDSYAAADLAFIATADFFSSPGVSAQLDYRPNGAGKHGSGILAGPPAAISAPVFSLDVDQWPPTSQTVQPECVSDLQACPGPPEGWCPNEAANASLVECQFDATWGSQGGYSRVGNADLIGSIPDVITVVSQSTESPNQGALHYSPENYPEAWPAKIRITATWAQPVGSTAEGIKGYSPSWSTGGSGPVLTDQANGYSTWTWNRQRQDQFTCPSGEAVNANATGAGDACKAKFFKKFITAPSFQQDDQCGVGDPCVPGSGAQTVTEPGFRYGNIAYDLYYNSLRQLKPYAYIDHNWSSNFTTRILTEWSQDHVTGPETYSIGSIESVFVQNEKAQLEVYKRIDSASPGVFRSTHAVGDVLRYFSPPVVTAPMWKLTRSGGKVEFFDRAGRLIGVSFPDDPRKNLTISYMLSGSMDDPAIDINSDLDHLQESFWRIDTIADGTDRSISFHYTDPQFLRLSYIDSDSAKRLLTFGYDSEHRLSSVKYAKEGGGFFYWGRSRHYLYNEASNIGSNIPGDVIGYWLTGIRDENNARYSTFKYDDWGRAVSSWHGLDAEKVEIEYPEDSQGNPIDSTAIATMPTGSVRTFSYGSSLTPYRRPISVQEQSPDNPSQIKTTSSEYDSLTGRLVSSENARGFVTKYYYEPSGSYKAVHETSRIEAWNTEQQRRIETDWDSVSNRVVAKRTYADPLDPTNANTGILKAETSYEYSPSSGQLLSRTEHDTQTGAERTWTYTYCETVVPAAGCPMIGLLHAVDGPRTDVSDIVTYSYYGATDLSGCASPLCHHSCPLS